MTSVLRVFKYSGYGSDFFLNYKLIFKKLTYHKLQINTLSTSQLADKNCQFLTYKIECRVYFEKLNTIA